MRNESSKRNSCSTTSGLVQVLLAFAVTGCRAASRVFAGHGCSFHVQTTTHSCNVPQPENSLRNVLFSAVFKKISDITQFADQRL